MKIVHTADVHLRNTDDERWNALGTVVDSARACDADAIVISGDLFDRDGDAALRTRLRARFEGAAMPVIIIPGNHDTAGIRSGDYYGANVTLITGEPSAVDLGEVRVVGLPFADGNVDATFSRLRRVAQLRRAGACNVLLYHGELLDLIPGADAFGGEGHREYMPARLSDFASLGFDYVLAGHFHTRHAIHRAGETFFVYSGSPASIRRSETGRRCFSLVTPGKPPEPIAMDTFHYERVDVTLVPEDGRTPRAKLEHRLAALQPGARALVRVDGFVDLSLAGLTEEMFHHVLTNVLSEHGVDTAEHEWRDVSAITRDELYRRFELVVAERVAEERDRIPLRNFMLKALMETMNAR